MKIDHGLQRSSIDLNRAKDYMNKSSKALLASSKVEGVVEWEITTLYYAAYYALYSVLLRFGFRSENHTCTIEFGRYAGLKVEFVEKLKKKRQDAQYYNKNLDSSGLREKTIDFLEECKVFLERLDDEKIMRIRKEIGMIAV